VTTRHRHPLAQLLRERNMRAHQLAARLNTTERLVYYWLSGERVPTPRNIALMSEVFHLPPAQLLAMFSGEMVPRSSEQGIEWRGWDAP
jgi:transcriptional regulator with XRE-family HTH domain